MREGKIQAWLARLSDRERSIVLGGGLVVLAALLGGVAFLIQERVTTMEEAVAENAAALGEIRQLAPGYVRNRRDDKAIEEALERARTESLQSLLLAVAKDVQFERKFGEGEDSGGGSAHLAEYVKFSNANEILAELTTRKGKSSRTSASAKKKKAGSKTDKQVFLASIEVVFDRVPDVALFQFLEKIDTHPDGLFATSLDISRESPNHEHFRAKMTIAQFRYGGAEEGS